MPARRWPPQPAPERTRGAPLYGCGLQRIDAASAPAARSAPSAASIQVISVGCCCRATSFGRSANTSRSWSASSAAKYAPPVCSATAFRVGVSATRNPRSRRRRRRRTRPAPPPVEDAPTELVARAGELRGLGRAEADRVDAHPPLDRVGHGVERLDPAGVPAVGQEHDDVRHVVVGALGRAGRCRLGGRSGALRRTGRRRRRRRPAAPPGSPRRSRRSLQHRRADRRAAAGRERVDRVATSSSRSVVGGTASSANPEKRTSPIRTSSAGPRRTRASPPARRSAGSAGRRSSTSSPTRRARG